MSNAEEKNTKLKAIDLAVVILCLAGSFTSGAVFWQEYNRTLTRLNDEPVGTIIFKKRTAQRKFIDRIVWDSLKKASSIYNGDTIRTIEFSEAVVVFRDETELTLNENTMLQIFYSEFYGAKIEFAGGQLEINSGSRSVEIISGSSQIKVEGQANLNTGEKGFSFSVLEGEAVFDGEKVEQGGIIAIDSNGERDTSPAISMTSFGSSAQVLGVYGEAIPVVFSWMESFFNSDTHVIVEVALDVNFTRIAGSADVSGANTVSINLENGSYRWRAYPAEGGKREPVNAMYPSGTLEVIPSISATVATGQISATESASEPEAARQPETIRQSEPQSTQPVVAPEPQPELAVIQVISKEANWEAHVKDDNSTGRTDTSAELNIGKEIINGQEKDVFILTSNLAPGSEFKMGQFYLLNKKIIQKLKEGSGIRFKVLGDGKAGWDVHIRTLETAIDNCHHEAEITSIENQIVEVDIPYSKLKQPYWGKQVQFNKNNIELLLIQRDNRRYAPLSGTSTIKIFDFEIY